MRRASLSISGIDQNDQDDDDDLVDSPPSSLIHASVTLNKRRKVTVVLTALFFLSFVLVFNAKEIENAISSASRPLDKLDISTSVAGSSTSSMSSTITTKGQYGLRFWSADFHISPVADVKMILSQYGSSVVDQSLSSHCYLTNSCATSELAVINKGNGMELNPCPNDIRRQFYAHYSSKLDEIDAFLCLHATSMCELYMPFRKPLIAIASTRYEIGRTETNRWMEWTDNLRRIASKPGNFVAANNK